MFTPDLLKGQTILVTGGGTGLGRAMAERFGALGARVAVCGRRPDPLDATVAAIRGAGGEVARALLDVRDPDSVARGIDELEAALGPLDGLVNNAAGNFLCASEELSPHAFDAVVRTVLHGTFHATLDVGRRWIARGTGGTVLSIVTTYAWTGSAFVAPSAAAKAGVLALMRSLAVEWAEYGIRANAIAPGPFPTEGAFSKLMVGGMEEMAKNRIPLRRFGEPRELADLAAYMMAPGSAYMTGECVVLDGGEWLKAGQEFGGLTDFPRDSIKQVLASMRPPRKHTRK